MKEVAFAKTTDRHVLGSLNDFGRAVQFVLDDGFDLSLHALSLRLAETPILPLDGLCRPNIPKALGSADPALRARSYGAVGADGPRDRVVPAPPAPRTIVLSPLSPPRLRDYSRKPAQFSMPVAENPMKMLAERVGYFEISTVVVRTPPEKLPLKSSVDNSPN